jgi:UrcA family protein
MSRSRDLSLRVFVLTVTALTGAFGASAGPKPASLDPVVTVRFDDLNLSTAAGTQVLYARLSAAARAVCSTGADWYPSVHWAQAQCYRSSLDHAVAILRLPGLTALHRKETQRLHAS